MDAKKTLILDNYDSFTYNLFQYVAELGGNPVVVKNDEITVGEVAKMAPTHIIISPGPGTPEHVKDFGVCVEVIKLFSEKIPTLGVCLGHQGILHQFGARVIKAPMPMHGKTSVVQLTSTARRVSGCRAPNIFYNLPRRIKVMRYHSLVVLTKDVSADFVVTATTVKEGAPLLMAIQHKTRPLWGIQFHPESIETPQGKAILRNFLGNSPDA